MNTKDSAAIRVGKRIRRAREYRRLTIAKLAEMVGLSFDRLQKYENGFRKPKEEMLNKIAEKLQVSPESLLDPVIDTEEGALYALFEMEELYGFRITKSSTNSLIMVFDNKNEKIYDYLRKWEEKLNAFLTDLETCIDKDEKEKLIVDYLLWKACFPQESTDITEDEKLEIRKTELQNKIQVLQAELDKLNVKNL